MSVFDLAVIGAGPAGLLAAIRAAEVGANVVLLEKGEAPGKKLLLTGGGRCNLTNLAAADLKNYGIQGGFLRYALNDFGVEQTRAFFKRVGVETKIEANGRVFPQCDSAAAVLESLKNTARADGVRLITGARANKWLRRGEKIAGISTTLGDFFAAAFIVACGGKTYPETGSNGDGYVLARALGHKIVEPRPALAPLILRAPWSSLAGISVKASAVASVNNKKMKTAEGDVLFTHRGLSGPAIMNLSENFAGTKDGKISLNFLSDKSAAQVDALLKTKFSEKPAATLLGLTAQFVARRLAEEILRAAELDPRLRVGEIKRAQRWSLAQNLTACEFAVTAVGDWREAHVTAGGVDLSKINPRTLASKLTSNVYFAGEVLNLHGPSGGYNLQIAWSTGALAGKNSAGCLFREK